MRLIGRLNRKKPYEQNALYHSFQKVKYLKKMEKG